MGETPSNKVVRAKANRGGGNVPPSYRETPLINGESKKSRGVAENKTKIKSGAAENQNQDKKRCREKTKIDREMMEKQNTKIRKFKIENKKYIKHIRDVRIGWLHAVPGGEPGR